MIALPAEKKPLLQSIPWFGGALTLITLILTLILQSTDNNEYYLFDQYQTSGLYQIEIDTYPSWLRLQGNPQKAIEVENYDNATQYFKAFSIVAFDQDFISDLHEEGDRYWQSDEHQAWKELRQHFTSLTNESPVIQYGLQPANPNPISFISLHFLNSGFIHWLVCMLVLALYIVALEGTLGSLRTALISLSTAVLATICGAVLLRENSMLPLYSSSVLVSALFGMYLGFFRTTSLPFLIPQVKEKRFSNVTLSAWLITPVWLLLPGISLLSSVNQGLWVLQLIAMPLGVVLVQLSFRPDFGYLEEKSDSPDEKILAYERSLTNGWASLGAMAFANAEHNFLQALKLYPEDFNALSGLYQIRKLNHHTTDYEEIRNRIIGLPLKEVTECQQQLILWQEIKEREPNWSPNGNQLWQLIINLCAIDALREADSLAMHAPPEDDSQSKRTALEQLTKTFRDRGNHEKADHYEEAAKGIIHTSV